MPKKPPARSSHHTKKHPRTHAQSHGSITTTSGQPVFAQPKPSPDPSGFKDPVTDSKIRRFSRSNLCLRRRAELWNRSSHLQRSTAVQGRRRSQRFNSQGRLSFTRWATPAVSLARQHNRWSQTRWSLTSVKRMPRIYRRFCFTWATSSILWRGDLLLRSVLRTIPRLSGADSRYRRQSRWRRLSKGSCTNSGCLSAKFLYRNT